MNISQYLKTTSKRVRLIGGILLLLVIIGVGYYFFAPKKKAIQYQTEQAQRGTLVISIAASGQVSSINNAPVNTQASGVISKVFVHNGDTVKAGQAIAQINLDLDGNQRHAQAYASYLAAFNSEKSAEQSKMSADAAMWSDQMGVISAQNNIDYLTNNTTNPATKNAYTALESQNIYSSKVQADKQFSASETKYEEADNAINAAKAAESSSWLTYQQSAPTIVAPIAGKVDGMSLETGEIISVTNTSTTSTNSQKVATIRTDATPLVTINLTEIDIPTVKIGDRATVTFDAFADKSYTGKVISIDSSGVVSSGVTTYPTVIKLDTDVPELFTNMSASANVITNTKDNALLISSGDIQTQNGQSTVRILKNGKPQTVTVQTGLASDTQTEITSGLSENDTVITSVIMPAATTSQSTGTSPFSRSFGGGGGGGAIRIGGGGRGG